MKGLRIFTTLLSVIMTGTVQAKAPPTQVVYRFDDHRYLELKGFNCEGELWFIDTQRKIHSEVASQFYRIFTHKFVHPSERYIAITSWEADGFAVSKDYGQTWQVATFSSGPNEPDGMNQAPRGDAISFTVVNEQGFLQTKHSLYMSSKPFDDLRLASGGGGIQYRINNDNYEITPQFPGPKWGMSYMTMRGLEHDVAHYQTNWQDLPDQVPEVKAYKGWDHMSCDMDAGK
ncbi:T6SS immunity protein Tli3 family protein [Buttiauxella agrestis]|uniref:T6SS immunity protein Tli3 family protein n=1 Tax=Buttiauxella agrestis TaxID=82977 RepID=UPI0039750D25